MCARHGGAASLTSGFFLSGGGRRDRQFNTQRSFQTLTNAMNKIRRSYGLETDRGNWGGARYFVSGQGGPLEEVTVDLRPEGGEVGAWESSRQMEQAGQRPQGRKNLVCSRTTIKGKWLEGRSEVGGGGDSARWAGGLLLRTGAGM